MLGIYNYTVILTYIGMLSGFTGIVFAMQGNIHSALLYLIVSGVCDMFDGKIASTMERTHQEKRFGIQIDSLSDLICFGVLPAVLVITACRYSAISYTVASMFVLSALIRLAWFNVDEEERQDSEDEKRVYYQGLPVTLAAAIVPLTVWTTEHFGWRGTIIYPVMLALMAVAFLIPFKLKRPSLPKLGLSLCGAGVLLLIIFRMGM